MAEKYRYRIINTGAGSSRFGNCEVCKKPADTMYHLIEERHYKIGDHEGWTQHKCHSIFGHKRCVNSKKR